MSELEKNPLIEWRKIDERDCLFFIFKGILTQKQANIAVREWQDNFAADKSRKITIVWQCLEMKGYEPLARTIWQEAIKSMKKHIDSIWLVTHSSLIKAGAKMISLFTSFHIKVVKSEKEILLK